MYTIKATINGTSYVLHDPRFESEGCVVISPVMTREVNRQGSLSFQLAQTHPLYDTITRRTTFITVYNNNDECWRGRVMSTDRGWNNVKTVYCEGELAYLNDSIVRPRVWHGTRKALFNRLIRWHNGMVDSTREFVVDLTKTNLDDTNTITLTTDSVLSTWEVLEEKILDYGYIMTERVNGETRIYCVTDFTEEATQTVEFGKNLLDLSESADATNVITHLIPYGDFLEEGQPGYHAEAPTTDGEWNGNRLTIELANNGSDIIGNALAESIWGKIVGTAVFDSIKAVGTTEAEIRPYAQRLLNAANGELTRRIAESITLEVKAVDLSMINPELDSFGVGKYITAISTLHGIHIRLLCRREEIYLTEPHKTTYTLGAGFKTLTDLQTTEV